jgi:hypothetical protein
VLRHPAAKIINPIATARLAPRKRRAFMGFPSQSMFCRKRRAPARIARKIVNFYRLVHPELPEIARVTGAVYLYFPNYARQHFFVAQANCRVGCAHHIAAYLAPGEYTGGDLGQSMKTQLIGKTMAAPIALPPSCS